MPARGTTVLPGRTVACFGKVGILDNLPTSGRFSTGKESVAGSSIAGGQVEDKPSLFGGAFGRRRYPSGRISTGRGFVGQFLAAETYAISRNVIGNAASRDESNYRIINIMENKIIP